MIRKPDAGWDGGDDRLVETARQFGGAASQTLSAAASGMVRVRAAYSSFVTAFMAAISGLAALSAGALGRNLPMAVLAGCFSLLLGWLALWNFRKAFGGAQATRAVPGWDADVVGSVRAAGQAAHWASDDGQTPPTGDTKVICYDRAKIFLRAATLFLACLAIAAVLTRTTHKAPGFSLIGLAVVGLALWHVFGLLLKATDKDLTAISWNNRQILVRTLTSSCQVRWDSFESALVQRRTARLLRLIPIYTTYTLMFRLRHNGSTRRMNVPAAVLAVRSRDIMDVMRKIDICRAQYSHSSAGGVGQRNPGSEQALERSFHGAREAEKVSAAGPARRTQGFETYEPSTITPGTFGRKVT